MYLTAEPSVPDRGHCNTAQGTASTGLVKPKKLSLIMIKGFDLRSEHLRSTEQSFQSKRTLRGFSAACC